MNLKTFKHLLLSLAFFLPWSWSLAQTNLYTEGTDLDNTGSGTKFSISSAGTYNVKGGVETPNDGQDRFQIELSSGLKLSSASWTGPSGATINFAGYSLSSYSPGAITPTSGFSASQTL